jgi:hypothetical protein
MRIGIDPGANGSIACKIDDKVHAFKMPGTPKDILLLILSLKSDDAFCWIEQTGGYMPGNSGPAAVKFARHCGHLDMALLAAGISHDTVLPAKWEHWLIGKPNYERIPEKISEKERSRILAKRKTERKNKIKVKVQGLYPDIKVTLALADALGLLTFGLAQGDNK